MAQIDAPVKVALEGGVMDGDVFEIVPLGSILPPMRLSYPYRDVFDGEEHACWLNYECDHVAEWVDTELIYHYVGKEKMSSDR